MSNPVNDLRNWIDHVRSTHGRDPRVLYLTRHQLDEIGTNYQEVTGVPGEVTRIFGIPVVMVNRPMPMEIPPGRQMVMFP